MKWIRKLNVVVWALLAFGSLAPVAEAAPVRWKAAVVDYAAEGKDIKDVLRDFGASEGIATRISPDVSGSVSGKFHLPPRRFLDMLSASFGFVWYYDGEVLDIVAASELQSTLVKLDAAGTAGLSETLERLHIADDRFPIIYDDTQGTAVVSGPPRYVQMVTQIAARLDANAARRGGTQVRVFPLNHAWAEDRTVQIDGQPVTLQGVVSVLNGIYHPHASKGAGEHGGDAHPSAGVMRNTPIGDVNGNTDNGSYGSYVAPPMPGGTDGKGLFGGLSGQPSPSVLAAVGPLPQPSSGASQAPAADDTLPVIVADQRTNSVVIRDRDDRMDQYDALIGRLDVKPALIEIEAQIIEVDDTAMQQLGVDWTAHNSHLDVQTGTGTLPQNTFNGSISQTFGQTTLPGGMLAAATPAGASVAAVLGDAGRYLMARISALQQTNAAKIDASPKVVTLNNIEAVMENNMQFFVPVSGHTSGDLYSISTGISLRVLPMVVEEDGQTRIKLDVAIQDGELTSQMVSNLPVIESSNITTQAFINEGQALLIAGYRMDNDSNGVTGVPGLSKIPGLGALFRTNNQQTSHMDRLFLLSPRVISP